MPLTIRAIMLGVLRLGTLVIVLACNGWGGAAYAATPQQDLAGANVSVQRALSSARLGDLAGAQQAYDEYNTTWVNIEDGVKASSRDSYRAIERSMRAVSVALAASPADATQLVDSLAALDREQQLFIAGEPPSTSAPAAPAAAVAPAAQSAAAAAQATSPLAAQSAAANPQPIGVGAQPAGAQTQQVAAAPTMNALLDLLAQAHTALATADYVSATAELTSFENAWLDVEGQVKTRSVADYQQTENDMALAASLASQSSPQAADVVARMATRLEPYREAQRYGIFDAAIILLREGLEALLVIAALSAFLKKSGNAAGQSWLWTGAIAGLLLSIVLGLAIQAFFGAVINPGNREIMEGVIGLFAAAMLIYISYWLHSKASLDGWQTYINSRTSQAIEGGQLFGLAVLAFLAVFREGAETALFYLGMVSNISSRDLFIGLALGFIGLLALGFLLVVVGVRIPMRPFFSVASLLVFYLCFKFVGTGLHALQVAGLVPTGSASYLPTLDFIGLYPTWPTTLAQLILLGAAAWVLLRERVRSRVQRSASVLARG